MADKARKARQIESCIDSMNRSFEWIKSNLTTASKASLNLRLQDTIATYNLFEKTQDAYELLLTEDEYKADVSRQTFENLYYRVRPEIETRLEELNPKKIIIDTTTQLNSFPKLPDIKLPVFSGNLLRWSDFYESFKSLVHLNKNLSEIVKFQYLKNSLEDAALSTIASLDFTAGNYLKALELLIERYDNEKFICEEHIRSLVNHKPIDKASSAKILEMVDNFKSHIGSLTTMKRPTAQWDDIIVFLFVSKLDSETRSKWLDVAPPKKLATFNELLTFITSHCHKLDVQPQPAQFAQKSPHSTALSHQHNTNKSNLYHRTPKTSLVSTPVNNYFCVLCDKPGHSILRCHQFLILNIHDRRSKVVEAKICYNCLKKGHMAAECSDPTSCRVCSGRHHTLLHINKQSTSTMASNVPTTMKPSVNSQRTAIASSSSGLQSSTVGMTSLITTSKNYIFLATALIYVLDKNGKRILARALLDSGSQISFVSEGLFAKLGLKFKEFKSTVYGIGGSIATSQMYCPIKILSRISEYCATIDAYVLPKISQPQPVISCDIRSWNIPDNIKLADDKFNKPQHIDLLLGAEIFCNLLVNGQIRLADDLPMLQNTVFGWVVSGSFTSSTSNQLNSGSYLSCLSTMSHLEEKIELFWKLETVDSGCQVKSSEEQNCEEHFVQNTKRINAERFVVRLPFKEPPTILGNSFSMAQRRFFNVEKRLGCNPSLKRQYVDFIKEYLQLGHMTPISSNTIPQHHYFLPHHCVLKPDSSTTKLRVVFDGSAKSMSGKSLNEILMVGAVVQNDLFTILTRFRSHKYVFCADISKMYRQIYVYPEDTDFQLILWRDSPNDKLQIFRLNTVTYATASAPFLATRCLKELAITSQISHPLGSAVIKDDIYVDDILTGANSIENLLSVKMETIELLQSAGMELRKWYSNTSKLLQDVPIQDQEALLRLDEGDFIKTLGVFWQPINDEFHIKINVAQHLAITKRSVMSDIARTFDPLGLLAPVITMGKLFMQNLWSLKAGWDDQLPSRFTNPWRKYRDELPILKSFRIPRHFFKFGSPSSVELHGFADASEKAYGAVIYTRCCLSDGNFYTSLLCAKSRVSPLSKTTLPRLELCAAQLLSELMKKVKNAINFETSNIYYWSDSMIVLNWIRSPSSTWKTFVANRVTSIQGNKS